MALPLLAVASIGMKAGGMFMDAKGKKEEAKAIRAQNQRNAKIERTNRRNQNSINRRNIRLLGLDNLRMEEETRFVESLLRSDLANNTATIMRGYQRKFGTARARNLSEDILHDLMLERDREIMLEEIAVENKVRENDFSLQNRIYDNQIEVENIGIRQNFSNQASEMREEAFEASASDTSYLWSSAGSLMRGGMDLIKTGSDLNLYEL